MILIRLEVGPFATNCYIVGSEDSRQGIVIDPGDEAKRILKEIRESNLIIKIIVLTHGHSDHTAALRDVKEETAAPIAIHSDDIDTFKQKLLGIFMGAGFKSPPPPDMLLNDGEVVCVDGLELTVIHTPGHSRGSICLLGNGFLFSGDTLFNCGVGRSDLPGSGGNHEQLIESIRNRLLVLDDNIKVYPGHGPDTTIGAERQGNPFLV
ncbi:MAG: MBL fold metallo-hydrolase [Dehalococcoidia bacterium]|nr:MAG: MBL fold metallo-hydrolase [Dehalococcoidia bacterium]